ncbi:thiol-disulfide oxidoreductase [Tateyamaria omphalii]|uniref:thiol-disulfide oxidoreductase DCC family protein n=1 Tax=Tateyamaria omphalii TaxID=299262 RepID=UPI00167A16BC|nr:DCC1-like thiol-disulfide oxidoreductase family protein [Tateyamaria omphalii]GGX53083.1 thiol-disulfide oxidoreductase [Tateyamaria omphalii]
MPRPNPLSPDLMCHLNQRDVIVFDGECALCSGFFKFMLHHDRNRRFDFVLAQSPLGARLYTALNLPTDDFETNLVIVDGLVYQRLDAFAVAMSCLDWPWKALSTCRFLPRAVKDPLYHLIARNRYAIFGRYDTCMMPDAGVRSRFVAEGWT